jgi:hypothetical protein
LQFKYAPIITESITDTRCRRRVGSGLFEKEME